jgi:predicted dinucleotide-binding enzyme
MKIGILGSGDVGRTLAKGFKAHGHTVTIGSREGNKLASFSNESGIAEKSFNAVVDASDVVVLCVKGAVAEALVKDLSTALASKVVLDATNPIAGDPKNGILRYFTGPNDSLLQRLQKAAPDAKFVKAFNSCGAGVMVNPKLSGGVTPTMFICGDDPAAKATTTTLCKELGWRAEDVGGAEGGTAIEALCQLWCAPGFVRNDWAPRAFVLAR